MAGRIEAYREEWAVSPERLRQRPWDAGQEQAWEAAVHTPNLLASTATRAVERSLEHGMEQLVTCPIAPRKFVAGGPGSPHRGIAEAAQTGREVIIPVRQFPHWIQGRNVDETAPVPLN